VVWEDTTASKNVIPATSFAVRVAFPIFRHHTQDSTNPASPASPTPGTAAQHQHAEERVVERLRVGAEEANQYALSLYRIDLGAFWPFGIRVVYLRSFMRS